MMCHGRFWPVPPPIVGSPGLNEGPYQLAPEAVDEKRSEKQAQNNPGSHPQEDVPWGDADGEARTNGESQHNRALDLMHAHGSPPATSLQRVIQERSELTKILRTGPGWGNPHKPRANKGLYPLTRENFLCNSRQANFNWER